MWNDNTSKPTAYKRLILRSIMSNYPPDFSLYRMKQKNILSTEEYKEQEYNHGDSDLDDE